LLVKALKKYQSEDHLIEELRMKTETNYDVRSKRQMRESLEDRLIGFSIDILKLSEDVPNTKAGSHICGQLVRCATSPALNYGEAQSAESRVILFIK
jgi:hypothetical protein